MIIFSACHYAHIIIMICFFVLVNVRPKDNRQHKLDITVLCSRISHQLLFYMTIPVNGYTT